MAELFDLATTAWGLYLLPQLWEANPLLTLAGSWMITILVKLLVTAVVVAILEGVECWPAMVSLVPIVATVPGVWNLFSMVLEIVSRVK